MRYEPFESKNLWPKLIHIVFLQWRINGVVSDIFCLNKIVEITKKPIDDHSTPKHKGCCDSQSFLSRKTQRILHGIRSVGAEKCKRCPAKWW